MLQSTISCCCIGNTHTHTHTHTHTNTHTNTHTHTYIHIDTCSIRVCYFATAHRGTTQLMFMCREEKPTRCHWMVYYTYNMLNMFRALLCASSGARDYMCFITAYGVRYLGCWLLEVRCRAAGYAFVMRDVAGQSRGGNKTHIVSSSWWWA